MSLKANKKMLAGNVDADALYPDAVLMLLNLITGYADTDADLCIKIMSLCRSPEDKGVL